MNFDYILQMKGGRASLIFIPLRLIQPHFTRLFMFLRKRFVVQKDWCVIPMKYNAVLYSLILERIRRKHSTKHRNDNLRVTQSTRTKWYRLSDQLGNNEHEQKKRETRKVEIEEFAWMMNSKGFGSSRGLILRTYPGIHLEGLRKTTKTLSQNSRPQGRDLNSGPPENEGVLTIRLRR
jgi:hypothetical protein